MPRRVGSAVSRNSLRGLTLPGRHRVEHPRDVGHATVCTDRYRVTAAGPLSWRGLGPVPPVDIDHQYVYSVRTVPMGQRRRSGPPPIVRTAEQVAGPGSGPADRRAAERNCARCGASRRKSRQRVADLSRRFVGAGFVFSPRSVGVRYAGLAHGRRPAGSWWAVDIHSETNGQANGLKLVLAIIHDYDVDPVLRALIARGFSVTRIASAGGFLRTGNVTILIGAEDDQVDLCVRILGQTGSRRVVPAATDAHRSWDDDTANGVADVSLGGVSVFVLPVERFERIMATGTVVSSRQ